MSSAPEMTGVLRTYGIELLFQAPPRLDAGKLLAALQERCGTTETAPSDAPGTLLFTFPDLQVPDREGGNPVQYAVRLVGRRVPEGEIDDAALQTRDWDGARPAVERHRAHIVVTDLHAAELPYKNRLRLMYDVVAALLDLSAPLAIHWRPSCKIVSPVTVLRRRPDGKPDPLSGAVNLRCAPASDGSGARVMDTLGLGALGLPDLECVLREREPGEISPFLKTLARYVYDLGDVIPDGRVIRGPDGKERWVCSRDSSTEEPSREVIRLTPEDGEV